MDEPADDTDVMAAFRARRTWQYLVSLLLLLVLGTAYYAVGGASPRPLFGVPPNALFTAAMVAIVAGLVFSRFNWRCPACRKYLGKSINPTFCAKCGVRLR